MEITCHGSYEVTQTKSEENLTQSEGGNARIQKIQSAGPDNVFFYSSTYFTKGRRTSLEKQLDPRGPIASRGGGGGGGGGVLSRISKETYKYIATCDFPGREEGGGGALWIGASFSCVLLLLLDIPVTDIQYTMILFLHKCKYN